MESLNLDSRGVKKELKSRLSQVKKHGAEWALDKMKKEQRKEEEGRKEVELEYGLVIDFEATCEAPTASLKSEVASHEGDIEDERPGTSDSNRSTTSLVDAHIWEIIEFPIVLIDLKSLKIIDTFQTFVKPLTNPILSKFCTELTGITQSQVDNAPTFPEALELVNQWLLKSCSNFKPSILDDTCNNDSTTNARSYEKAKNPGKGIHQFKGPRYRRRNWTLITDGRMDLEGFLSRQLDLSQLRYPPWSLGPYLDSRSWFTERSGVPRAHCKVLDQLRFCGLVFEGREHSGLDDAVNIGRVVLAMIDKSSTTTAGGGGNERKGVACNRFMEEIERGWMPNQKPKKQKKKKDKETKDGEAVRRAVDELD